MKNAASLREIINACMYIMNHSLVTQYSKEKIAITYLKNLLYLNISMKNKNYGKLEKKGD